MSYLIGQLLKLLREIPTDLIPDLVQQGLLIQKERQGLGLLWLYVETVNNLGNGALKKKKFVESHYQGSLYFLNAVPVSLLQTGFKKDLADDLIV